MPNLPPELWQRLNGRLWHATTRSGLSGILSSRAINPGAGTRYACSFCRLHNAVCLFDFGGTATHVESQFGNWSEWLGIPHETKQMLWLEIDRHGVGANLWDAEQALLKKNASAPSTKLIPGVEGCHLGPIPSTLIISVIAIASIGHGWREYGVDDQLISQVDAFEVECPTFSDERIKILLEGRRRIAEKSKRPNRN